MTTNDETRAALVNELGSVMHSLTNDDEALIQLVYTPNDYAEKVLMPIIDRLLANLWRSADDWDDVQVKVAEVLEGEVKCDVAPDSYHAKLEEMTSEIVTTLLTALIGPRPQGENDEQ